MLAAEFDRDYLWRYRARLLRVIDGDTCVLLVDCGFNARHEVTVRLADVWAVERYEDGGGEAAARLGAMVSGGAGEWPLRVTTRQRVSRVAEVRSFTRYVADIDVVMGDGTMQRLTGSRLASGSAVPAGPVAGDRS